MGIELSAEENIFARVIAFKNEIVKRIDECQEIKRYLTYMTDCPNAKRARLGDGTFIKQDDIEDSLIEKSIIPRMDYGKIVETATPLILIHIAEGTFEQEFSKNSYAIDIVCPTKENANVEGLGQERLLQLATYVTALLDKKEIVGASKAELKKHQHYRISKQPDFVGLTLFFEIVTPSMNFNGVRL